MVVVEGRKGSKRWSLYVIEQEGAVWYGEEWENGEFFLSNVYEKKKSNLGFEVMMGPCFLRIKLNI